MEVHNYEGEYTGQPLKQISFERLTSLLRHWGWADEARQRFERELAAYPDEHARASGSADRLLGAYYHWGTLLCSLGEAATNDALVSHAPLETIQEDLHAGMPWLCVCRKRLVDVPASYEHHPSVADLQRDKEMLARLRRVHRALGEAFRSEEVSREVDSLDH